MRWDQCARRDRRIRAMIGSTEGAPDRIGGRTPYTESTGLTGGDGKEGRVGIGPMRGRNPADGDVRAEAGDRERASRNGGTEGRAETPIFPAWGRRSRRDRITHGVDLTDVLDKTRHGGGGKAGI